MTDVQAVRYLPGDINGDGVVNIKDLASIKKLLVGDLGYDMVAVVNCDMDDDKLINVKDVSKVKARISGAE